MALVVYRDTKCPQLVLIIVLAGRTWMGMDVMNADTLIPFECAHLVPWHSLRAFFIWTVQGSKHIFF